MNTEKAREALISIRRLYYEKNVIHIDRAIEIALEALDELDRKSRKREKGTDNGNDA